jgi:hypothetical protein
MRIQLEFTPQTGDRIKALKNDTGAKTYSELFANALSVYEWVVNAKAEDDIVVQTDKGFNRPKELVLPMNINIRKPVPVPNNDPVPVGQPGYQSVLSQQPVPVPSDAPVPVG